MFGPNITGESRFRSVEEQESISSASGAFTVKYASGGEANAYVTKTPQMPRDILYFNASGSNSTYAGSALQPKSLQILPCIRF